MCVYCDILQWYNLRYVVGSCTNTDRNFCDLIIIKDVELYAETSSYGELCLLHCDYEYSFHDARSLRWLNRK